MIARLVLVLILSLARGWLPGTASAQSSFHFQNLEPPFDVNAPVYDWTGNLLDGSQWRAELYGGPDRDSVTHTTEFLSGSRLTLPFSRPGYFFSTDTVVVPDVPPEHWAWLQVKVWDANLGSTYEQASARRVGGYGESPLFYAQGGNPVPPGVSLPRPLIGLESFSVLQEVPEPSAWLLFAVGIGGLAWRVSRRRGVLSPQRQRPKLSSFRQCGGTITQCAIVVARSDPDAGLARPGGSVRRLSATRATAVSWGFQTIATLGVIALFAWLSQLGSAGAAPNVIAWGDNCYDQTDVPPGLMNPVAVAAGNYHSLALKCDGTVAAWGAYMTVTSYVPATVPTDLANVVAIAAGLEHSVALRADGTVIAWGANSYGQANVPLAVRNAAALAGGYYFSVALLGDGPPIVMECRPIHRFAT